MKRDKTREELEKKLSKTVLDQVPIPITFATNPDFGSREYFDKKRDEEQYLRKSLEEYSFSSMEKEQVNLSGEDNDYSVQNSSIWSWCTIL